MRQRPLPAARGKPGARLRKWDSGSLPLHPPPLHPFPGPRAGSETRFPETRSFPKPEGQAGTMLGNTRFTRGSEATRTHPNLSGAAPLGTRGQSLLGYRRWFGSGIAYGQDRGFCGQRGALGSLSASSIFQLGDLGQGTYIPMCLSFLIFKMERMIPTIMGGHENYMGSDTGLEFWHWHQLAVCPGASYLTSLPRFPAK